jgi:hypothetical protein
MNNKFRIILKETAVFYLGAILFLSSWNLRKLQNTPIMIVRLLLDRQRDLYKGPLPEERRIC